MSCLGPSVPPCASVAWCFEVSLPHFTTSALLHEAGNRPQSQAVSVSRSYPAALRADAVHAHGRQLLFLIVQLGGRLAALAHGVPRRRLRRLLGLLRLGLISACATSPICKLLRCSRDDLVAAAAQSWQVVACFVTAVHVEHPPEPRRQGASRASEHII